VSLRNCQPPLVAAGFFIKDNSTAEDSPKYKMDFKLNMRKAVGITNQCSLSHPYYVLTCLRQKLDVLDITYQKSVAAHQKRLANKYPKISGSTGTWLLENIEVLQKAYGMGIPNFPEELAY
jgi:hypothetical protein